MTDVIIYASGAVSCSVCAPGDMPIADIEAAVNLLNLAGIAHGWRISTEAHFAGGQPMPCVCEANPARKHYLLNC